jgi:hypothetical protein
VVIRSSRSTEIERLIGELRAGTTARRDAAVARLRVMGGRAVDRIAALAASDAPAPARAAALRALEGSDEARLLDIARPAAGDTDSAVAIAAIGVLRGWVMRERGTEILDLLSRIALEVSRDAAVRLAALDALSELPPRIVQPLLQQAAPSLPPGPDAASPAQAPDDPLAAAEWIGARVDAPLSILHDVVIHIRDRERREASARARQRWMLARGTAHAALARRGSRVALYDLRESFDSAQEPLPLDFLAAVTTLGDESSLESLARAWAAAAPRERWWRDRLRDAAADIVKRERLTGRHAIIKRIRSKYSGFL